jgi:hypothetical protein
VCLYPSTQHTWPQLYACLSSMVCPFCISSHPQLGQLGSIVAGVRKSQSTNGLMPKHWAQRAKGSHLIYLCKQVTEEKARSNSYMVIYNSIGYFTLVLCDFSPPQCYVTLSTFRFLRFYLSAMPYLLPVTLSELRPTLFSSDPCVWKHCANSIEFV